MEFIYTYERGLIEDGRYAVNHPLRLDVEDNQIYLATEIEDALPGKLFIVSCNNAVLTVSFSEELNASEIAILDGVVQNHKDNA